MWFVDGYVLKVWDRFKIKTMKDYHDLFLKYDALLLADGFEKWEINVWELWVKSKSLLECIRFKTGFNT